MKPSHIASLFAVLALAFACGSEDGENGAGTSSGSTGQNGSSNGGFGTSDGGGADGSSGGTSSGGTNCLAPVDMFVMFDRSGSMARKSGNGDGDPELDCNIGDNTDSKWCRAINALSGYFKSAGSANQAAALQFFPRASHDKQSDCSTGDGYNVAVNPASEYQTLPSDVFDKNLNDEKPATDGNSPGTPTEAAIRGLTRFTTDNRRGGRVTIGILLTDGDPFNDNGSQCNTKLEDLSKLLKDHHDATQVRTYVIGMDGASDDKLEEIAAGGDAPLHPNDLPGVTNSCGNKAAQCRHWNVGDGNPAVFGAVLKAIQESADGCKDGGGFVNPVK